MTRLAFDPLIGVIFRDLLRIPTGVQCFTNGFEYVAQAIEHLVSQDIRVTGITTVPVEKLVSSVEDMSAWQNVYRDQLAIMENSDLALFNPVDKFHVSLSAFPFDVKFGVPDKQAVSPRTIRDRLQFFKCSEGKPDREIAYHLLGLEQMLRATLAGGYFAAVLPKRWVGREMKYLRWWNDNAALVARIKLPGSAVSVIETDQNGQEKEPLSAPGEWELCFWNRPTSESSRYRQLRYAEYRYSPFVFPLESLSSKTISDCCQMFHRTEWWSANVVNWHDALESLASDSVWGTFRSKPRGVDDPKEIYFFNPKPEFATSLKIVKDVSEIKKIRHAVHVKPGRTIKLTCYDAPSQCALLDLRAKMGTITDERTKELLFKYDQELKFRPFTDIREQLLSDLENQGLTPCMTEAEHHKLLKRERWLSIQLTPCERYIPASRAAARSEGQQSGEEADWELAYDDIGMEATFPEIMEMWRNRAKKMNLDRECFGFQFEDLPYYAAKQCLANTNVMGLGKTRFTLFSLLLRGVKRALIVVPAKLIGIWQDEIDNTISPYVAFQKRDWQGKMLSSSYQVIEWAEDLLPANLKTFNIVSYDKLKSVARDGKFFKCPRCGTVVYSRHKDKVQLCPGDPALPENDERRCNNLMRKWRKICAGDPEAGIKARRKIRVVADSEGLPFIREDEHGNSKGYMRVHWQTGRYIDPETKEEKIFPLERTTIVDERPPRPQPVAMDGQSFVFKKYNKKLIGYDVNKQTGEKTPAYANIERSPHVRWTVAKLVRNRFSHVVLDEALYIMNEESQRSQALDVVTGRNRYILTGTPMKNKPENILNLLNWCFPREVFPSYRSYDQRGLARFLAKYRTEVYVGGVMMPDGTVAGGKPKPLPKVNNPELFQAEMAPLQRRHVRNEPKVLQDIPRKKLVDSREFLDMDPEHRAYYELWLKEFADWWAKMKEEEEGRKVPQGALLTKLTYLINASTIPHNMLDNITANKDDQFREWAKKIGKYQGKRVTRKLRRSFELIKEAVAQGDKTIVGSWRQANLKLGQSWCEKNRLPSMVVDGTVSLTIKASTGRSKRHEMIEKFRHDNYWVLWAGLDALAEGMNIEQANHVILLDCGWAPMQPKQLIGRTLRPAQTKTIFAPYLMHKGTIDDYMFALSYLKGRSADEAIDYMEFDNFSTDLIPDIHQYADAIVDGNQEKLKQKMWLAVDHLKRQIEEEGEE